jgi:hypothetical protein
MDPRLQEALKQRDNAYQQLLVLETRYATRLNEIEVEAAQAGAYSPALTQELNDVSGLLAECTKYKTTILLISMAKLNAKMAAEGLNQQVAGILASIKKSQSKIESTIKDVQLVGTVIGSIAQAAAAVAKVAAAL